MQLGFYMQNSLYVADFVKRRKLEFLPCLCVCVCVCVNCHEKTAHSTEGFLLWY